MYRCQSTPKLSWRFCWLDDKLQARALEHSEIRAAAIKTCGRNSLSGVALMPLDLCSHILGPWLDATALPSYMKTKLREIFESHASYRKLYAPHRSSATPDTTWLATWPAVGHQVIRLLDRFLYTPNSTEESVLRQAVRHGKSAQSVLTMPPWAGMIAEINLQLSRTAVEEPHVSTF